MSTDFEKWEEVDSTASNVLPNAVQVNAQVIQIMNMNRKDRRAIAKKNKMRMLPSINNVTVRKAEPNEIINA